MGCLDVVLDLVREIRGLLVFDARWQTLADLVEGMEWVDPWKADELAARGIEVKGKDW